MSSAPLSEDLSEVSSAPYVLNLASGKVAVKVRRLHWFINSVDLSWNPVKCQRQSKKRWLICESVKNTLTQCPSTPIPDPMPSSLKRSLTRTFSKKVVALWWKNSCRKWEETSTGRLVGEGNGGAQSRIISCTHISNYISLIVYEPFAHIQYIPHIQLTYSFRLNDTPCSSSVAKVTTATWAQACAARRKATTALECLR